MLLTLFSGLALGLAAGVAPGPLSALVVSQTLCYGVREGIKVAAAPLVTDLPIIILAIFVGSKLASAPVPLGMLSLVGAVYICYLGWESLSIDLADQKKPADAANSMSKGILTNLLNPHPYLFWITVGTPLLLKIWSGGPWGAMLWLICFYLMLVGSKIGLSLVVSYSRRLIYGRGYLWLNRILGLVLFFFALVLAKDGLTFMGVWPE
jgi:threonine/homoserine/homoserine lactone efflux protein